LNLHDIPIFGMLRAKMSWLNERQRVVAENIANSSTQGYKARDLAKLSFNDLLQMAHDQARAFEGPQGAAGGGGQKKPASFKPKVVEDGEMTPNGNSVVLEEQMMKVSETQTEYQSAIEIYRQGINLLRMAVRS
jgi:flagellar basal-body rod protein FlgB